MGTPCNHFGGDAGDVLSCKSAPSSIGLLRIGTVHPVRMRTSPKWQPHLMLIIMAEPSFNAFTPLVH
jgi:hypothetical protein